VASDPAFRDLLDSLSTSSLSAAAIGTIAHGLMMLNIRHGALEKHIQARASISRMELTPFAINSYVQWLGDVHAVDIPALQGILEQIVLKRAAFNLQSIVFTLKGLAKLHTRLLDTTAIRVLCDEFVLQRFSLRSDEEVKYSRMGEFCRVSATLGLFTPELVEQVKLLEYCMWASDKMNARELNGILCAFGEAHFVVPDEILKFVLSRICALAPVMKPGEIAEVVYNLGRGPFEGLPLNDMIDEPIVQPLCVAVSRNANVLNMRDIGKAVYGLAGLPRVQPHLNGCLNHLARAVRANVAKQNLRTVADLMMVIEGFAGLSDIYQCSRETMTVLLGEVVMRKHLFDTEQATRALRALATLPHCRSVTLEKLFRRVFPDASKFPSKEDYDAFQDAIAELPPQLDTRKQEHEPTPSASSPQQ